MKCLSQLDVVFVDTVTELRAMMDDLEAQEATTMDWHLCVDFEGVDLCRHGEICIGQFSGKGQRTVYVVDFVAMNPMTDDERLASMLANDAICKLLFDPRNDADALGSLYGVTLRGALCLQLAEAAHRKSRGIRVRFVRGLAAAMQDVKLSAQDRAKVERVKAAGKAMFCPDVGGSYHVFKYRPLDATLQEYCAMDVYFFDEMKAELFDVLPQRWKDKVRTFSRERERAWTKDGYDGQTRSKEKAECPF